MKSPKTKLSFLAWAFAAALYLGIGILALLQAEDPARSSSAVTNIASGSGTATQRNAVSSPTPSQPLPVSAAFERRPFKPVRESKDFQWTAEDGTDTNVIRRLAHNDLEFTRLAQENARIYRRQLVYHTDGAAAQIERAKATGRSLQQITFPGLDGQEVPIEITRADLNPSGQQGALSGTVAGRSDSMVTLAFKGAREAFTILSPKDNLYLVGEPREPGELIVKSINPETYVVGVCGNPDR